MKQLASGDYKSEPLAPEELKTVAKINWREAVIGAEIPKVKFYAPPLAPSQTANERSSAWTKKLSVFKRVAAQLGHSRKTLLILLGFAAIGAYYPEAENLSAFLVELRTNDAAILAMGTRFHQGGSPHAGAAWKHHANRNYEPAIGKPAHGNVPPTKDIEEIGSEDLGNGFLAKTIVITEVRDGVRTQRTTTITVQSHPPKTKKMKAKKVGSAQLKPGFSGKIA